MHQNNGENISERGRMAFEIAKTRAEIVLNALFQQRLYLAAVALGRQLIFFSW